MYNANPSYLVFSCEKETGECTIKGIRKIPDEEDDGINYLIDTRAMEEVMAGSKITPIYTVGNLETAEEEEKQGESITFKRSTTIQRRGLPDGQYLGSAVISDIRGDSYYSAVVSHTVSGGNVTGREINDEFVGLNY